MRDSVLRQRRVRTGGGRVAIAALVIGTLSGCSESPTEVEFQVIEEVDFAASLNVDLSTMTKLATGTYYKDLVVGGGEAAVRGDILDTSYMGWLTDGTLFVDTNHEFQMGNDRVPPGLEDGLLNMREGGTRQIIVAPGRGYGGLQQVGLNGTIVPGGSVLVYEVTLNGVN